MQKRLADLKEGEHTDYVCEIWCNMQTEAVAETPSQHIPISAQFLPELPNLSSQLGNCRLVWSRAVGQDAGPRLWLLGHGWMRATITAYFFPIVKETRRWAPGMQ